MCSRQRLWFSTTSTVLAMDSSINGWTAWSGLESGDSP
jgi:hypothetical protein